MEKRVALAIPTFIPSYMIIFCFRISKMAAWRNMTWICVINVCKVNSYSRPIYHKLKSVPLTQVWMGRSVWTILFYFFKSWFQSLRLSIAKILGHCTTVLIFFQHYYEEMTSLSELLPLILYLKPIIESKSPQY